MKVFRRLLVNTLVTGVTSSFLWFALTFWVYLETRSVVATGMIGGAYSLSAAVLGPVFGTYVDRHRKHKVMTLATLTSAVCFTIATAIYVAVDGDDLLQMSSPWFWFLIAFTLFGSVAVMMRSIALSTTVTLLVPEDKRDRANGMVGTVTGNLLRDHVRVQRADRRDRRYGLGVRRCDGVDVCRARASRHHRHRRTGAGESFRR